MMRLINILLEFVPLNECCEVQKNVAENETVSVSDLIKLSRNEEEDLINAVAENMNIPSDVILNMVVQERFLFCVIKKIIAIF